MTNDFELNVIDSLPEWQRVFCHSPAFKDCVRILEEMRKQIIDGEEWETKRCELMHAKMVFDDLCAKDPECIKQKEIIHKRNDNEGREKRWLELFETHKKMIMEDLNKNN